MNGFITLSVLALSLFSCSKDKGSDIAPGIGQRAQIGVYETTEKERADMQKICDSLHNKESSFDGTATLDKYFNYSSTITENGCSSGAVNLSQDFKVKLELNRNNKYVFTDDIAPSQWLDPADKAHLAFAFESNKEGQGQMNIDDICVHVVNKEEDRVLHANPNAAGVSNTRLTYRPLVMSPTQSRLDVFVANESDGWINSRTYSIIIRTDGSSLDGLVETHEISQGCNPAERKFVTYKSVFSSIE